jgi:hypothetical protein
LSADILFPGAFLKFSSPQIIIEKIAYWRILADGHEIIVHLTFNPRNPGGVKQNPCPLQGCGAVAVNITGGYDIF